MAHSNIIIPKRRGAERPIYGPNGMKLKQIQFRSYIHDIGIYHFQAYFVSLYNFRFVLNRKDHGYVDTLLSYDPLHDQPVPAGDEIPVGCIEVVYMPNVFQHGGSALGFRVGANVVEWMCFDRDVDEPILKTLETDRQDPKGGKLMLFDHVADLLRGVQERRIRGTNLEHRTWHESLRVAGHRRVMVNLTWKTFGTGLQRQHALQRMAHKELEHAMSDLNVSDQGSDDGDMMEIHDEDEEEEEPGDAEDEDEDEIMVELPAMRSFIYEDEVAVQNEVMDDTPLKRSSLSHKRSSSSSTVLGEKDTNTLRMALSSKSQGAQDKQLMNGGYA
ncbi:Nn.00g014750.m01.CDS01 [Neocucurbitaria sp. VM-36]